MTPLTIRMLEHAKQAMQSAYAPYSRYPVGACIRTEHDHLFSGTNVENVSYSLSLCAETAAIAAMVTAGYRKIYELVVIGPPPELCTPCGACRQRLNEFSPEGTLIHLCDLSGVQKTLQLSELLPYAFGPKHLCNI